MTEMVKVWVLGCASLPLTTTIVWPLFSRFYHHYLRQSDYQAQAELQMAVVGTIGTFLLVWHCFQMVSIQIGWSSLVVWLWTWLYLWNGPIISADVGQKISDHIDRWLFGG